MAQYYPKHPFQYMKFKLYFFPMDISQNYSVSHITRNLFLPGPGDGM